ncbi:Tyrosine-protein kinase Drl [Portunus trituberculatus]|uniref:Tyrosine-protein kinase Drl n=1 Tax=Portunus trituberculatus TaxID=210409 RepID=A0A5B7GKB8_PORTR|nr:Tyrosine-protein kinase Drl [Portunus trituberculatus]
MGHKTQQLLTTECEKQGGNRVAGWLGGLTAELYYVREGVVNDYALNWRVPVAANVHRLYFKWQALTKKPVSTYTHHRSLSIIWLLFRFY